MRVNIEGIIIVIFKSLHRVAFYVQLKHFTRTLWKAVCSSILVLMAANLVEDIIRNIYVKLFVYDVQGMSFKDSSV